MTTESDKVRKGLDAAYGKELTPEARTNLTAAIERLVKATRANRTDLGAGEFDLHVRRIDPGNELTRLLRQLREKAGLTQAQAAQACDWSVAKMNRVETGSSSISVSGVRALLMVYRVEGPVKEQAIELARRLQQRRSA